MGEHDGGEEDADRTGLRRLGPKQCVSHTRRELAAELPAILQTFLAQARSGSIPHLKMLIEMAELDRPAAATASRKQGRRARSLSEYLLTELRRGTPAEAEPDEVS